MNLFTKNPVVLFLSIAVLGFVFCWYISSPLEFDKEGWRDAYRAGDRKTLYRMSKDLDEQIASGLIQNSQDAVEILSIERPHPDRILLQAPFWGGPYYLSLRFSPSGRLISHGIYPE